MSVFFIKDGSELVLESICDLGPDKSFKPPVKKHQYTGNDIYSIQNFSHTHR